LAKLRVALRQSQVLCKLRRVCRAVAFWQQLYNGRRAAPFGVLSRTHKVLCPRKNKSGMAQAIRCRSFVTPPGRAK
jgi:hypothetical protein